MLNRYFIYVQMSVKATRASFRIIEELMKHGKPFSDGEIVKKCLIIAAEELTPDNKSSFAAISFLFLISLTRNTVADRADNIGDELEANLKKLCKRFVAFSIALDESTDIVDTAQLAVFIRGVTVDLGVYEEFLCTVPLLGTTTGEDIFMAVKSVFLRFDLDWANLKLVSTDGAKAMTGIITGFRGRITAHLKSLGLPEIPFVHCVIHRENLGAQSLAMKNVMGVVKPVANFVREQGLNHREFRQLLQSSDLELEDISFYTEVRWLSRGKTLKQFVSAKSVLIPFLEEKASKKSKFMMPNELKDES